MARLDWSTHRWLPIGLGLLTLLPLVLLYASTAAPDVLAGDGGEFQTAAPLLAVPHPTGYPLYILLGKLATFIPIGSLAYRVTLVSVGAAALTVMLLVLFIRRITGSILAALVGGVALALSPGLWNAATIAEVYALNALIILALAWSLVLAHTKPRHQSHAWLFAAAAITGLGVSLHGSFAFIAAPLLVFFGIIPIVQQALQKQKGSINPVLLILIIRIGVWGAVGTLPWLFVLEHYARLGPFNGLDHGLLRFQDVAHPTYFWGAPVSWQETLDHLFGGVMRREGVFQLPQWATLQVALPLLWERLWFEFGHVGVFTGAVGGVALFWLHPRLWLGSVWVASVTVGYFLLLGHAVQDALVFTLPFLLPWSLWVGVGAITLAVWGTKLSRRIYHLPLLHHLPLCHCPHWQHWQTTITRIGMLCLLLGLTLAWGNSRMPYSNKHHLWLFRTFGEGVLARMEPDSVVMVRWEQGTILYYLRLVEGQRPDVWVDIVEPEDEEWLVRAQRRYAHDAVYVIGNEQDGVVRGLERVWGTEYAVLYRLQ